MSTIRSVPAPRASRHHAPAAPAAGRVRCPTCGAGTSWQDNPQRPFCSLTCRLIDLGGWLDERYRIPSRDDHTGSESSTNVP
ncbi:MAG: DNA gyrase inhibitor YacG [Candidatus Rokubacteria bacterium]|nr:DNA gyrase inhibitor YacG [Candidatus Rokubacteria bacterium]